jgi:hypothetical protein
VAALYTTTRVPPDVWDIKQCGPGLCTVELKRDTTIVYSTGSTDVLPARQLARTEEGTGSSFLDRTQDEVVLWTRPGALALYASTVAESVDLSGDYAILHHLLLHADRPWQQG